MRYFISEYSKSELKKYDFCDYCGINLSIHDMDIAYEIHYECWKSYRMDNKLYKQLKYHS